MLEGFHPQLTTEPDMLNEQVRDALSKALYEAGRTECNASVTVRYSFKWDKNWRLNMTQQIGSRTPINERQDRVTRGEPVTLGSWTPEIPGQARMEGVQ